MAKRKPKLTDVKQAYRRERQRIQRQINRMTKRGYDVPELLPKIPKKITEASVRRLKKLTTEKLYKESRFIDFETGETVFTMDISDKPGYNNMAIGMYAGNSGNSLY